MEQSVLFNSESEKQLETLMQIRMLIERGAMFFVNHSGGKDSQAMLHYIVSIVPRAQITVIHAELPGVEWDGVEAHIRKTTLGLPILTCRSRRTLLEMIEERGMFPSPSMRQCTSDLKRGPIKRTIRRSGQKLVVNCMGMRSEESASRAKQTPFKLSEVDSKNGREWYDWLPVHHWKRDAVFAAIKEAGQQPHWAYDLGMSRLSCCFCIMSSKEDLTIAAKHNPTLYAKYVQLEKSTGQVMLMPSKTKGRQTLEQLTGVQAFTGNAEG
jgi:DNA sulfur modification protein DndC